MPKPKEMKTWAGRSRFRYEGSVRSGTIIHFGSDFQWTMKIDPFEFGQILNRFSGKEVNIGTSRTTPPQGSLGEWIKTKFGKAASTSYVGPILVDEGFAIRGAKSYLIQFRSN
jgi:hypothetical protein